MTIALTLNSVIDFPLHRALTGLPFSTAWDLQTAPQPQWGTRRQESAIIDNYRGGRSLVFDRVPGSESLARVTEFLYGDQSFGVVGTTNVPVWFGNHLMGFGVQADALPRQLWYFDFPAVLDGTVQVIAYDPTLLSPSFTATGVSLFSSNMLWDTVAPSVAVRVTEPGGGTCFGYVVGAAAIAYPADNQYCGSGIRNQKLIGVGDQAGDFLWSNSVTAPYQRLARLNAPAAATAIVPTLDEDITFDIAAIQTKLIDSIASAANALDQGTPSALNQEGGLLCQYNGATFNIGGTNYSKVWIYIRFAHNDYFVLNPIAQDAETASYLAASWSGNRGVMDAEGFLFANGRTAGLYDDLFMGRVFTVVPVGSVCPPCIEPLGAIEPCGDFPVVEPPCNATWPYTQLQPRNVGIHMVPATLGGGPSMVGGREEVKGTANGFWRFTYGDIPVHDRDQILKWREMEALLEGRAGVICIHAYEGKRAPWLTVGGAIVASAASAFTVGSRSGSITVTTGGTLRPGMHFSYNDRLYRLASVGPPTGSTYAVTLWPNIRAEIPAAAPLEFARPMCRARLADDRGMSVELDLLEHASQTVAFEEDI